MQVHDHLGFLIVIIYSHSKKIKTKDKKFNKISKIIKENAKKKLNKLATVAPASDVRRRRTILLMATKMAGFVARHGDEG